MKRQENTESPVQTSEGGKQTWTYARNLYLSFPDVLFSQNHSISMVPKRILYKLCN
jgi:hypothetical protein